MSQRRARSLLAALAVLSGGGCASTLDMTSAYDPSRPATTITYTSVRGARQFPDYESIGRSILTGADPAAAVAEPAPKSEKAKGAKK